MIYVPFLVGDRTRFHVLYYVLYLFLCLVIVILCALLSVISVPLAGLGQNAISCSLLHVIYVSLFVVYFFACNFCFFV